MSFCRETERTARKEHKCSLCHKIIKKGEKYIDHVDNIVDEAYVYHGKECLPCLDVKKEFLADYPGDGYNEENIREWWQEEKCWKCGNRHPTCKPDEGCETIDACVDRKNGRCTADYCDDMTHYCRCEKFKVQEESHAQ